MADRLWAIQDSAGREVWSIRTETEPTVEVGETTVTVRAGAVNETLAVRSFPVRLLAFDPVRKLDSPEVAAVLEAPESSPEPQQ